MRKNTAVLSALVLAGLTLPSAAQADVKPRVRGVERVVSVEGAYAVTAFEYRCSGEASYYAEARRVAEGEVLALYTSTSASAADQVSLVCDGEYHAARAGMVALGGSETEPGTYGYLEPGTRVQVSVELTTQRGAAQDTRQVRVEAR
jgi:hypothetical protein